MQAEMITDIMLHPRLTALLRERRAARRAQAKPSRQVGLRRR